MRGIPEIMCCKILVFMCFLGVLGMEGLSGWFALSYPKLLKFIILVGYP